MFVLHVGPHKTATTWLQVNFHENIAALEKAGWYYPRTGERVRVAHHDISDFPEQIFDETSARVKELRRIAERANAEGLNILMSSEGFRNWKPAALKRLGEIMAPHEMSIVYCARDPVSLLYSFWAQQVKTGSKTAFPEFHRRQFARPRKSRFLNVLQEIKPLERLAGPRLRVLLYDEIRRQNRDIFDVFCTDILGIEELPHVRTAVANERQPVELTEFMRLMLLRIDGWKGREQVNIGRMFQYFLTDRKKAEIIAAVAQVPAARRILPVSRQGRLFRRVEGQLFRIYKDHLVPKPASRNLFLTEDEACVYYDADVLAADPGVARLLDETTRKFRPGGLRMRFANAARETVMTWRRLRKRVGL